MVAPAAPLPTPYSASACPHLWHCWETERGHHKTHVLGLCGMDAHVVHQEGPSPCGSLSWCQRLVICSKREGCRRDQINICQILLLHPGFVQPCLGKDAPSKHLGKKGWLETSESSWERWPSKLGSGITWPDPEICRAACLQTFTGDKPQETQPLSPQAG